jgi:hypothetical protein
MDAGSTTSENAMKGYRTKRIALPGGRMIEIVYFYDEGEAPETAQTAVDQLPADEAGCESAPARDEYTPGLHECPDCNSDLVYPVSWEERTGERWRIERRCPNCEWRHEGEFDQDEVEEFDDMLNEGTESLLTGLRNFSRANMVADIEGLIDAINADQILPMDF